MVGGDLVTSALWSEFSLVVPLRSKDWVVRLMEFAGTLPLPDLPLPLPPIPPPPGPPQSDSKAAASSSSSSSSASAAASAASTTGSYVLSESVVTELRDEPYVGAYQPLTPKQYAAQYRAARTPIVIDLGTAQQPKKEGDKSACADRRVVCVCVCVLRRFI
jgi:hypothetical protein